MNIEKYLPYWHKGRYYPNRFEQKASEQIEGWQHPDQQGLVARPNGYEILRVLEAQLLHRVIGLATLLYYQKYPNLRPKIFQGIHMCGWLDVVYGPYGENLFTPTLTPIPVKGISTIHWMNLSSGFNCLDFVALRCKI